MDKRGKKGIIVGKGLLCFAAGLFVAFVFCACGLETIYVMEYKPTVEVVRNYDAATDPNQRFFEFYAARNSNAGNAEFRFLGTAVYYKIYTSPSTMISHYNYINSVNNSTNYSAAAEMMIRSYGYRELFTDVGSVSPLVPAGQEGHYVRIRLTNYNEANSADDATSTKAEIIIKPNKSAATVNTYAPRRSRGSVYSFDFGRSTDNPNYNKGIKYDVPQSGDEDFYGSGSSDNKYYVALYAVAVGRDLSFSTYYSNVAYLGSIMIDASLENN